MRVPHPCWWGGTPPGQWGWSVAPSGWWRYPRVPPPHWDLMGVPHLSGLDRVPPSGLDGVPPGDWMGIPSPISTGWGYPPSPGWDWMGVPHPRSGDRTAETHSRSNEWSLRSLTKCSLSLTFPYERLLKHFWSGWDHFGDTAILKLCKILLPDVISANVLFQIKTCTKKLVNRRLHKHRCYIYNIIKIKILHRFWCCIRIFP